jgi:hypothetical protein
VDWTRTDRFALWSIAILATIVNIAGYLWHLYDRIWWFDDAIHAYTTFTVTLVAGLLLYSLVLTGAERYSILLILTITCVGLGFGAFWEIGEWLYDLSVRGNVILGKQDTMIDFVMDGIGAISAGMLIVQMRKRRT